MPVKVSVGGGEARWITPTAAWQTVALPPGGKAPLTVDVNFYVLTRDAAAPATKAADR